MTWLAPYFIFMAGVIAPGGALDGINDPVIQTEMTFGVELFDHWSIEGSADIYSMFPDDSYFRPYQADFIFNTHLSFGGFDIGYEHQCYHPMEPRDQKAYSGGYDKIYLRYEARLGRGNK